MSQEHPPVTLSRTEVRQLKSSIMGDAYRLLVALPPNYDRTVRHYPVVYLGDGNGALPLAYGLAEALMIGMEIPRLILVGIGWDTDESRKWGRLRERDYLPPDVAEENVAAFPRSTVRTGRAADFLRFIREEVQPAINAGYRADPSDSTYIGSSHGGLFGLYALFHGTDTFSRYAIGSPSLHHNNGVMFQYEEHYAASHDDLPVRLFLSVGGREDADDPLIPPEFRFGANVRRLAVTLAGHSYPNLHLTYREFDGESHVSVVPLTFSRGLRAVFG